MIHLVDFFCKSGAEKTGEVTERWGMAEVTESWEMAEACTRLETGCGGDTPRSLDSVACVGGCTLGPIIVLGASGCAFVRGDERGGERMGYFRAVFAADNCAADFAALDVEVPITFDQSIRF